MERPFLIVIDDEPFMHYLFQSIFELELKQGRLSMQLFLNPQEAYDFLIDLDEDQDATVVTDLNMPGMAGYELIARLQERSQGARFIVISAYEPDSMAKNLAGCLIDGYFTKPVDFHALRRQILA